MLLSDICKHFLVTVEHFPMSEIIRIQRISRIMRALSTFMAIFIPILILAVWLNFERVAPSWPEVSQLPLRFENLNGLILSIAFSVNMAHAGILLYGVVRLRRLFGLYSEGKIFTGENIRCLRSFAWAVLIYAVLTPVMGTLLSVILTFNNPVGERALAISISSNDIQLMFIGAVFLVIAWIMVEGRKLAEENAQIV